MDKGYGPRMPHTYRAVEQQSSRAVEQWSSRAAEQKGSRAVGIWNFSICLLKFSYMPSNICSIYFIPIM